MESANILKTTENVAKLCHPIGEGETAKPPNLYEETVKTQFQAAIFLPKVIFLGIFIQFLFHISVCFQVNVTFLQASIVEEIISFSALDNIKDLTCVSLFSFCFDNIIAKLHCDKQVCL